MKKVMVNHAESKAAGWSIKNFLWIVTLAVLASCSKQDSDEPVSSEGPQTEIPSTIKSGDTIKVMTYNIHHANPPAQNESIIDVAAIAAAINAEGPDFVALQEVDKNTKRSGVNLNEAQELANRTKMSLFFSKSIDYEGGEYGVAILSKYVIADRIRYQLPLATGVSGELRSVAMISVAAEGKTGKLYFASTHLEQSISENRLAQVQELLRINSGISAPLILAGDFNAQPADAAIITMQQSFISGCLSGCPLTYPAKSPSRTIDYVFLNQQASATFSVLSYKTTNEASASDHRPLVAELKYKQIN